MDKKKKKIIELLNERKDSTGEEALYARKTGEQIDYYYKAGYRDGLLDAIEALKTTEEK